MSDNDHKMLTRSQTSKIINTINTQADDFKKDKVNSLFPNGQNADKSKKKKRKTVDKEKSYTFIIDDDDLNGGFNSSNKSRYSFLKNAFEKLSIYNDEEEEDEEEDDDEVEYDEYDEQFLDVSLDGGGGEDLNLEYFHNLSVVEKKSYIKDIESLNKISDANIPLKFKVLKSHMPITTKAYALSLIDKAENETDSSEIHKMTKWIEGLILIPFNIFIPMLNKDRNVESLENPLKFNREYISNVHKCLNKAIYGHVDAKFHIIQLVARWLKNPDSTGNVLAIQGPMGNGKTTLVKEGISKALDRPFAFISLGGASDSSYLNGHSLTYEGSVWGRIVDILIKSKCMNPVIYFDELDKVSDTTKGEEIIHLLTHITDFSQNERFQDNYFSGIDIDLSKILFIFSFNDEGKVDRILKDRMHVINTKGFKVKEKIKISNEYLLPKLYESFKFTAKDIIFPENILEHIVNQYTSKEEGVRNLQRCLENIISKINMYSMYNIVENKETEFELPFKIKDFKLPYTVTLETVNTLIKSKDSGGAPQHMYL